jgi:hypothetical protein
MGSLKTKLKFNGAVDYKLFNHIHKSFGNIVFYIDKQVCLVFLLLLKQTQFKYLKIYNE